MNLRIEIDDAATSALRELAADQLPRARSQMVTNAATQVLEAIAENHPVRTGRARAAWSSALGQLGGQPTFPGSDPAAIAEGRGRGSASVSDDGDRTLASATNSVDYIPFLEYGTSRMAPRATVRRSLAALASQIAALFSLSETPHDANDRGPARSR